MIPLVVRAGCPPVPTGYVFLQQTDRWGADIRCEPLAGRTVNDVAALCNSIGNCVAFNVHRHAGQPDQMFCLKSSALPRGDHRTDYMRDSCEGLFMKEGTLHDEWFRVSEASPDIASGEWELHAY